MRHLKQRIILALMQRIILALMDAFDGWTWDDNIRTWARRALGHGGSLVLFAFMFLWFMFLWFMIQLPGEIKEAVESPPAIPPELADHRTRGDGLQRGPALGATPNKSIPRPEMALEDQGIDYSWKGSPNWSGRGTNGIEAIVVHVTGPGTMAGMASWFNNPSSQVSAHFGIGKDGDVHQYVEIGDTAWHAGICTRWTDLATRWCGAGINPNLRTVGIEVLLAGPAEPLEDYPKAEASLLALLRLLTFELNLDINTTTIIGHSDIDSINRATDPDCCIRLDDIIEQLSGPGKPVIVGETNEWGSCLSWGGRKSKLYPIRLHGGGPFFDDVTRKWYIAPPC